MAYWLARARNGQQTDIMQRFDARFWTVDFPRPMMASVITTGPDSLRVDCEFHHTDALAGLIWDSEDRYDHPLLAYDTDRNYARTTLSFRWRSDGILPLDAVHGPTLTIEGRDAAGAPRTWYVRLWNYATGAPDDAVIRLPFSQLREGWAGDGPAVEPSDIDRMFISLVSLGYDPASDASLEPSALGWAEVSQMVCEGDRSSLMIGDVIVPPHDLHMATAYDDSYNLTPTRVLRSTLQLGYRGALVHYVGMSHYYQLVPVGDRLEVNPDASICGPCVTWHENFLAGCAQFGFEPIISLSFEILAQNCPENWQQQAFDGTPSRTGWDPPSALISPASPAAISFLRRVAENLVGMTVAAGLPVRFQIGEPWWWVTPDGKPCLYDANVKAQRTATPEIADLSGPLDADQRAFLDWCGARLEFATLAIRNKVIASAGGVAEVMLLLFTPTILDPRYPELRRANLPAGWAFPAYHRVQIEDYDWLTQGADALRRQGYAALQERLGYPLEQQDYLAGFVLDPSHADTFWRRIDAGIDEARARGVERRFVWALPQVNRDGYTRLPPAEEDIMQSFDDVLYPLALGQDTQVSPEFSTAIALTASGYERRSSQWANARMQYDVGPGIRSQAELGVLLEFFRARRGPARGFRLVDPFDNSSNGLIGTPTPTDQLLGVGDGLTGTFRLQKRYGPDGDPQIRPITRPRHETVLVSVGGVAVTGWALGAGGLIEFDGAPAAGAEVRAGFLFDVPVRFAQDRLDISGTTFAAGEAPSVALIEIREDL